MVLTSSVFFPQDYDQTSPETLATVFTIHGGGFVIGEPFDDEECNRRFADMHRVLIIALNYHKAPWFPFPTATYDLEALMLAVYDDESLPIDKSRIAVAGYSAGGNLALSVCQLPTVRNRVKPSAAMPIYPVIDESIQVGDRARRRYYKPSLSPGLRNQPIDYLSRFSPLFKWSYIPYGQNLHDPLLSPLYAPRKYLPKHIYIVAAELDQLSHEAWQLASKLARRPVPSPEQKVGQEQLAKWKGQLILDDDRFAFQHVDATGESVRWLLVPDVVHGFDHLPPRMQGGQETVDDARLKTIAYQQVLGDWLRNVVWKK